MLFQVWVFEEFLAPAFEDYSPVFEDVGVVCEFKGVLDVLLYEEYGYASLLQSLYDFKDLLDDHWCETEAWFVEEEHLRLAH